MQLNKKKLEKFVTDKTSTFDDLLTEDNTSVLDNLVDKAKGFLTFVSEDDEMTDDSNTLLTMINEASSSITTDIDSRAQNFDKFHETIKNTQNQRKAMSSTTKEKVRKQQLEITKKLRNEAISTLSKAKNKEIAINAAHNPKEFALINQTSVGMIPKDMRSQIITNNNLMVGLSNDVNDMDKMIDQKRNNNVDVSGFISGVAKNPMKLYSYYFMSTALIGLFLLLGRTIFGVVRFITNALMDKHIANSLFLCPSEVTKDTVEQMVDKSKKSDPGLLNWIETNIGKTPEDRAHYYDTHNTFRNLDGTKRSVGIIELPIGSRHENYNFDQIKGTFNYSLSVAVKYIAIAVAIVGCIMILYKYVNNKVNKEKRNYYATVNQVAQESVTIEMLKESNDYNRQYYEELDLLEEGVSFGWLSKYAPTPNNILSIINKGIISTAALAKVTEEGLENNSISPLLAKVCNFFIAIGNTILLVAKGIMLGIISVTSRKKTSDTMKAMAQ